ncbi:hypothetical protein BT96DRAFT_997760 [Gymnopus androsaceus JB14]|uniref:Uncharacterized protein n=1 Tax=Gymnopus androsaceus JB14 TaxID=1447944 RepID=A0A6A4HCH7_9AGAR|nr:hypothetical protein BT96DRAFT_997760 [Gymnopus androsaceus JB14]
MAPAYDTGVIEKLCKELSCRHIILFINLFFSCLWMWDSEILIYLPPYSCS